MVAVFAFVNLTWIVFRAPTLSGAILIVGQIGGGLGQASQYADFWRALVGDPDTLSTVVHLLAFMAVEWTFRAHVHPFAEFSWPRAARWAVYMAVIADILYFGALGQNPFIYFQF
jgi:hypothetical protein